MPVLSAEIDALSAFSNSASGPGGTVDPGGKVVGATNLFVADASVMPEVSRTNTNIPTIIIAERIAETVRQR